MKKGLCLINNHYWKTNIQTVCEDENFNVKLQCQTYNLYEFLIEQVDETSIEVVVIGAKWCTNGEWTCAYVLRQSFPKVS